MSIDVTAAGSKEPRRDKLATRSARAGFFSIYKPKEGYWTRLGTVLGAAAVILFIAFFAFQQLVIFPALRDRRTLRFGICVAIVVLLAAITQWIMNAPRRAQFLIDTDSEMKKVNWASWPELIGATRVVVFFMLLTAFCLFVFDTQFHALFFSLRVWHIPFPAAAGLLTGLVLAAVLLTIGVALLRNRDEANKTGWIVTIFGALVLFAWVTFLFTHRADLAAH